MGQRALIRYTAAAKRIDQRAAKAPQRWFRRHPAQAGDGDVADEWTAVSNQFRIGTSQPGGKVGQDEKINAHIGVEQKRGGHHPNHETLPNPI